MPKAVRCENEDRPSRGPLIWLLPVFVLAVALDPAFVAESPVVCPFRSLSGHPCPGCGMTRSFVALAHGQGAEAVRFHPFGPLLFFLFVLVALAIVFPGWKRISPLVWVESKPGRWVVRGLAAGWVLWWATVGFWAAA